MVNGQHTLVNHHTVNNDYHTLVNDTPQWLMVTIHSLIIIVQRFMTIIKL